MSATPLSFGKKEHLVSKKLMEMLFSGGAAKSMVAYPVRMVYMMVDNPDAEPSVQVMVSVSKRYFKHAVKRNRVKRQLREAYRTNKQVLWQALQPVPQKRMVVALIWMTNELKSTALVTHSVRVLLERAAAALQS
ncbi:MAG: ribonuclease P protein component [Prevotella sp.]